MGDRPRLRKKYVRPKRLWEKDRIVEESKIKKEYGLKNMREIWRTKSAYLEKYRRQVRMLLSAEKEIKEKQSVIILNKLIRLGVLKKGSEMEDILSLSVKDFLERRLQTLVYRKGFAKTPRQARQLVVHGHIMVNGRVINRPGYMVSIDEEDKIRPLIDINTLSSESNESNQSNETNKSNPNDSEASVSNGGAVA